MFEWTVQEGHNPFSLNTVLAISCFGVVALLPTLCNKKIADQKHEEVADQAAAVSVATTDLNKNE